MLKLVGQEAVQNQALIHALHICLGFKIRLEMNMAEEMTREIAPLTNAGCSIFKSYHMKVV